MLRHWFFAAVLTGLSAWVAYPAQAATLTFDFDTGTPALVAGTSIPLDQATGGVTAHFSSPPAGSFSVQNAASTGYTLSQFSGNYLSPNLILPEKCPPDTVPLDVRVLRRAWRKL